MGIPQTNPAEPRKTGRVVNAFTAAEEAAAHFKRRGLELSDVAQLKLTLVDAVSMKEELGFESYPRVRADRIPFYDIDGTELLTDKNQKAVRFRRHLPRDGSQEKKYLSKKDSGCFVYLPQLAQIDWPNVARDAGEPLVIVEGEYKSIAACMRGITTVGLGGVWNFKGKHGLATPLPKFEWEARKVCIVFDADAECTQDKPFKEKVEKALNQLCAMLEARKAQVFILYLARTKQFVPGEKMGLDDYFDAGGDWGELMETCTSPAMEPQLAVMMERYAVAKVTKPHVLDLRDDKTYSPHDFVKLIESNKFRKHTETGKMTVRVAQDFLDHRSRPEFGEYVFDPNIDGGLNQERGVFNHWPGLPIQPKHNAEHEATYVRFMEKVCGEHFDFIVNWFAHIVQRPGEKTTKALLCMSTVNGAGKGMLGELHGALLGAMYAMVPLTNVCNDKFNTEISNRLLVQSDEADSFYKGIDSKLKDVISSTTVRIEAKGRDAVIVKNFMRLYITTNSLRPLRLDAGNRRLFVWRPPVTQEEARGEWGKWVGTAVKDLKSSPDGLAAVMHYLMGRDLSEWNATAPVPQTEEMHELVEASPTKNASVAQSIFDELRSESVSRVFVSGALNGQDIAVWTEFRELVKAAGGQKAKHSYTRNKRTTHGHVYDMTGSLNTRVDNAGTRWVSPGQINGEEAATSSVKIGQIYTSVADTVKPFLKGQ